MRVSACVCVCVCVCLVCECVHACIISCVNMYVHIYQCSACEQPNLRAPPKHINTTHTSDIHTYTHDERMYMHDVRTYVRSYTNTRTRQTVDKSPVSKTVCTFTWFQNLYCQNTWHYGGEQESGHGIARVLKNGGERVHACAGERDCEIGRKGRRER